jgi:hypothetical protein
MSEHAPAADSTRDHRDREVQVRGILLFTVILFAVVVLVFVAVLVDFRILSAIEDRQDCPPSALATQRQLPPAPRLQTAPQGDLLQLRAYEAALLGRYELLDETGGVVRVPIERAMELIAARGLPGPGGEAARP